MSIGTIVAARTGFFFGWWVVFPSAAIVFLTGGTFFYGFGALFNPIVNEFGWSRAATSFAFSLRSEVGAPMILSLRRPAARAAAGPAWTMPRADHVTVSGAPSSQRGQAVSS